MAPFKKDDRNIELISVEVVETSLSWVCPICGNHKHTDKERPYVLCVICRVSFDVSGTVWGGRVDK